MSIFCVMLRVKLARDMTPDGVRRFASNAIVDDTDFFFVALDVEHAGDAIAELSYPSARFGYRLVTRPTVQAGFFGEPCHRALWIEPTLVDGRAVVFARACREYEVELPGDDAAFFWEAAGPYAGAFLKHCREVALLLRQKGEATSTSGAKE